MRFKENISILICAGFLLSSCIAIPKPSNVIKKASPKDFEVLSISAGLNFQSPLVSDSSGNYYTKYNQLQISGICNGTVAQVKVSYTPTSGSATNELVNCSSNKFTWVKVFITESTYAVTITPLDSLGLVVNSASAIPYSKNITFDATNPSAPTFLTPSTNGSYTITNGSSSISITGQVLNEVTRLQGPNGSDLTLTDNGDGTHKDFSYNGVVPSGNTVAFTFTAYDQATNNASSTMTVTSSSNLIIAISGHELGGSHVSASGLIIDSSVGFMSNVIVNQNVKHTTGSVGILGNL